MKVKTGDLEGDALDWVVAKAVGEQWSHHSADWNQGGPLIEKFNVAIVNKTENSPWLAMSLGTKWMDGDTPLIAACRAIVAANLGDDVDVPDEII